MSVSRHDHEEIMRQTLQICEAQLAQRFHDELVRLRQRRAAIVAAAVEAGRAESLRLASEAADAATGALAELPSTPRRSALAEEAEQALAKAADEKKQLEDAGHHDMARFVLTKQQLIEEYEALYQARLDQQQQQSQRNLQQLIEATSDHASLPPTATDRDTPSPAQHTRLLRPASSQSDSFVRDEATATGAGSAAPARAIIARSPVRAASARPIARIQRPEEKEGATIISPGRIRPRSAKAPPAVKLSLSVAISPPGSPLLPSKRNDVNGGGDLASNLNFDAGVDELISSLNAALAVVPNSEQARYQILPDHVKGSLRDPGRTTYARRIVRVNGRAMSKVSRDLLIKLEQNEERHRERRRQREEDLLAQARLITLKNSPHGMVSSPTNPGTSKAKQAKKFSFLGADPADELPPTEQSTPAADDAKLVPLLLSSGTALDARTQVALPQMVDYAAIETTSDGRFKSRLVSLHRADALKQRQLDAQWAKEKKKKGSAGVDSVGLYLASTSTFATVSSIRQAKLEKAGAPTAQTNRTPQRSRLTSASRQRSASRERSKSRERTPSKERVGKQKKQQPKAEPPGLTLDLLQISPVVSAPRPQPARPTSSSPTRAATLFSGLDSSPTTERVHSKSPVAMPLLPLPRHDGLPLGHTTVGGLDTARFSDLEADSLLAPSMPDTARSSHRDWQPSQPPSARAPLLSSRSQPQLSHRSNAPDEDAAPVHSPSSLQQPRFNPTLQLSHSPSRHTPSRHRPKLSMQIEVNDLELSSDEEENAARTQKRQSLRVEEADEASPQPTHSPTLQQRSRSASQLSSSPPEPRSAAHEIDQADHEPPEIERPGTASSLKSRPSTGLRLSFSIPTVVGSARDGRPTYELLQVWPESGRTARDDDGDSSGLSTDSDDDDENGSRSHRPLSSSPPLTPSTGDALSDMLDSQAASQAASASVSMRDLHTRPTSSMSDMDQPTYDADDYDTGDDEEQYAEDDDDGPSVEEYTIASLRSLLAHLRSEVSELREERNLYQRELGSLSQSSNAIDLIARKEAEQETQLMDRSMRANLPSTEDGINTEELYTPEAHQLNLLYLRNVLYSAAKDELDLEHSVTQLRDEVKSLWTQFKDSREQVKTVAHDTRQRLQQHRQDMAAEQERCADLLNQGDTQSMVAQECLETMRELTRFWSQLHGFERDQPGASASAIHHPLQPECFKCHRSLVPSAQDAELAMRLLHEKRAFVRAHTEQKSLDATRIASGQRPASAFPASIAPRPTQQPQKSPSASSLGSIGSSARAALNSKAAAKTEWDMLEELSSIAASVRSKAPGVTTRTKHQTGVLGVADSGRERARLIRERSESKFNGGSALRPSTAVPATRGGPTYSLSTPGLYSTPFPTTPSPAPMLGPGGLDAAHRLQRALLSRTYVQTMCNQFTHVTSGRTVCRDCRYALEASSPFTSDHGQVSAFAPDQVSVRFFARRQIVPLEEVRPDLLQHSANTKQATSTIGMHLRPSSAVSTSTRSSGTSRPTSAFETRSHLVGVRSLPPPSGAAGSTDSTLALVQRLRDLLGFHRHAPPPQRAAWTKSAQQVHAHRHHAPSPLLQTGAVVAAPAL